MERRPDFDILSQACINREHFAASSHGHSYRSSLANVAIKNNNARSFLCKTIQKIA